MLDDNPDDIALLHPTTSTIVPQGSWYDWFGFSVCTLEKVLVIKYNEFYKRYDKKREYNNV